MNLSGPLLLELAVIAPLLGALLIARIADSVARRKWSVVLGAAVLGLVAGAWLCSAQLAPGTSDGGLLALIAGRGLFVVNSFNAPLLALIALVYLVTMATTAHSRLTRFSFSRALASLAITLATFASQEPWLLIVWLALGAVVPLGAFKRLGQSPRVYVIHMLAAIVLLAVGQMLFDAEGGGRASIAASACILIGVLLRTAIAPAHCWMTDLFERTSFGSATLIALPMTGVYAATVLLLPASAPWASQALGTLALLSSVYAAGMALVQRPMRRFFSFLVVSQSGLVLAGVVMDSPTGLAGGLCLWLTAGLSLAGLALVMRAVEVRVGRVSLDQFHGLYDRMPFLGAYYLLAGLALVGFPGTCGFIASEMLFDGALTSGVLAGVAVVLAGTLNAIAILQAYYRVFTGCRSPGSIDVRERPRERVALVPLALLILGIGVYPTGLIASRHQAATEMLEHRPFEAAGLRAADKSPPEWLGGMHGWPGPSGRVAQRPEAAHPRSQE